MRKIINVIIGTSILSFGMFNFHYRYAITEGGVLGLLLVFKHLFDVSPAISGFICDMICFGVGTITLGPKFLLKSLIATVWEILSGFRKNHDIRGVWVSE